MKLGRIDPSTVPAALRGMYEDAHRDDPDAVRYYYDLVRDPRFAALEMCVVVDWGPGALSWHQWALDKPAEHAAGSTSGSPGARRASGGAGVARTQKMQLCCICIQIAL
ncbi:hypothetical protein WMF38_33160 [Sorangium sp. So ce118]